MEGSAIWDKNRKRQLLYLNLPTILAVYIDLAQVQHVDC